VGANGTWLRVNHAIKRRNKNPQTIENTRKNAATIEIAGLLSWWS
jgi:hypothetical protein